MRHALAFLLLLAATITVQAQFRLASDGFVSVQSNPNDSTYVIDVTLLGDLTGSGYSPTNIQVGYYLFSQREQVYRISATSNLTFGGGTLTIIEQDVNGVNTEGSPIGQVMVYDPPASGKIPQVPFGSTGATSALQAAVVSYNSRVIGSTGSGITEAQARSIAADSVSVERAARQQADNAEAAARAQMVQDSATAIRSDFPAPGLQEAQVRAIASDSVALERSARIAADQAEANARQQAILDTAAAVRADFPVDTKLTQAEVQAFEADAAAISALADSTNAVRQDFPVPGISEAEARQIASDTATANRLYTDSRETDIRSTLADSTAAVRADFPSTANLVTNTDLAISEANSLADAQAYTNNVVADSTAGLRAEVPGLAPVQTVNGQAGSVNLTTADVPEGGNLYYTDARVGAVVSDSLDALSISTNVSKDSLFIRGTSTEIPKQIPSNWNFEKMSGLKTGVQAVLDSVSSYRIAKFGDSNTNFEETGTSEPNQEYLRSLGFGNHPETIWSFSSGVAFRQNNITYTNSNGGSVVLTDASPKGISRTIATLSGGAERGYRIPLTVSNFDNRRPDSVHFIMNTFPGSGFAQAVAVVGSDTTFGSVTNLDAPLGAVRLSIDVPDSDNSNLWVFVRHVSGNPVELNTIVSDAKLPTVEYTANGVGGSRMSQWANNFQDPTFMSAIRLLEIDNFQLQLGTNDSGNGNCETFRAATRIVLDSLLTIFRANDILVISPPERLDFGTNPCEMASVETILYTEATLRGVPFASIYSLFGPPEEIERQGLYSDLVHWNGKGKDIVTRGILASLVNEKKPVEIPDLSQFTPDGPNEGYDDVSGESAIVTSVSEVRNGTPTITRKQYTGTNQYTYTEVYRTKPTGTGVLAIKMPNEPAGNWYAGIKVKGYIYSNTYFEGDLWALWLNSSNRWNLEISDVYAGTLPGNIRAGTVDGVPAILLGNESTSWGNSRVEVESIVIDGRDIAVGAWSSRVIPDLSADAGVTSVRNPENLSSPTPSGYNAGDGLTYTYSNFTSTRIGGNYVGVKIPAVGSSDFIRGVVLAESYTASSPTGTDFASIDFAYFGQAAMNNRSAIITGEIPGNTVQFARVGTDYYVLFGDGSRTWSSLSKFNLVTLSASGSGGGGYVYQDIRFESFNDLTGFDAVYQVEELLTLQGDNLGNHTMTQTLNTQGFPIANMVDALNNDEAVPLGQLNRKITEAFQYQGNAIYRDTLHDAANAIVIPGNGDWINIDLTVSSLDTLDKPTFASGIDLWNEADSTVVALHDRASGWVRIDCSLDPAGNITSDPAIVVALDIGGTIGKISPTTIKLVNASRQNYTLFIPIYTRGTFVANGAKISVKALGGSDIEFMNQIDAETSAEQSVNIVINYDR